MTYRLDIKLIHVLNKLYIYICEQHDKWFNVYLLRTAMYTAITMTTTRTDIPTTNPIVSPGNQRLSINELCFKNIDFVENVFVLYLELLILGHAVLCFFARLCQFEDFQSIFLLTERKVLITRKTKFDCGTYFSLRNTVYLLYLIIISSITLNFVKHNTFL